MACTWCTLPLPTIYFSCHQPAAPPSSPMASANPNQLGSQLDSPRDRGNADSDEEQHPVKPAIGFCDEAGQVSLAALGNVLTTFSGWLAMYLFGDPQEAQEPLCMGSVLANEWPTDSSRQSLSERLLSLRNYCSSPSPACTTSSGRLPSSRPLRCSISRTST